MNKKINCIVFLLTLSVIQVKSVHACSLHEDTPRFVNTSVNDISLDDDSNIKKYFGAKTPINDKNPINPYAVLYNQSCDEEFKLFFHPGNVRDHFSEFQIKKIQPKSNCNGKIKNFTTDKNIKIGLKINEAKKTLGKPHSKSKNGDQVVYKYHLQSPDSKFLKKYNMPIYYGIYIFKNKELIQFSFGFEYP
jgi:hypothetical protein